MLRHDLLITMIGIVPHHPGVSQVFLSSAGKADEDAVFRMTIMSAYLLLSGHSNDIQVRIVTFILTGCDRFYDTCL